MLFPARPTSTDWFIDPELQLVGPSGAFKVNGTTNMADESLDMRLVVVLQLQTCPGCHTDGSQCGLVAPCLYWTRSLATLSKRPAPPTVSPVAGANPVDLRSVFDAAEHEEEG